MFTEPTPALHMRFFEFTSSNGNTAHVPVDQFLRIETFDDYQAGNDVVQVLFRNAGSAIPDFDNRLASARSRSASSRSDKAFLSAR
jgi:hypothetical protein